MSKLQAPALFALVACSCGPVVDSQPAEDGPIAVHPNPFGDEIVLEDWPGATTVGRVHDASAEPVAVGDFDGDGASDVIWTTEELGLVDVLWGADVPELQQFDGVGAGSQWFPMGDLDGDGATELAVVPESRRGFGVLFGGRRGALTEEPTVWVETPADVISLHSVGDLDGDGHSAFVVEMDDEGSRSSRLVFSIPSAETSTLDDLDAVPCLSCDLMVGGDVDGDGLGDLVLETEHDDDTNADYGVSIFEGPHTAQSWLATEASGPTPLVRTELPFALGPLPNVDGEVGSEILLVSELARAHLLDDAATTPTWLRGEDWTPLHAPPHVPVGWLGVVVDLDGDGRDDLVNGAPERDGGLAVYYGRGRETLDRIGTVIHTRGNGLTPLNVGDVNADGFEDLLFPRGFYDVGARAFRDEQDLLLFGAPRQAE